MVTNIPIQNEYMRVAGELPNGVHYFLIALLFLFVISSVIGIVIFAKWLSWAPKFKNRWNQLIGKATANSGKDGVKIKGKEIVVDSDYLSEIDEKIKNAKTPQELLEFQILKENHEKEKIVAEAKLKQEEEAKLEKLKIKEDRSRINTEAKEYAAKVKEEKKAKKAEKGK